MNASAVTPSNKKNAPVVLCTSVIALLLFAALVIAYPTWNTSEGSSAVSKTPAGDDFTTSITVTNASCTHSSPEISVTTTHDMQIVLQLKGANALLSTGQLYQEFEMKEGVPRTIVGPELEYGQSVILELNTLYQVTAPVTLLAFIDVSRGECPPGEAQ